MKKEKGFSLAEILQTIFVVGIIAGISLSFFKKHEPDKRIYDSTVKQIQYATANVVHKACSDELICLDKSDTTGWSITSPTCPAGSTFRNNNCSTAAAVAFSSPTCSTAGTLTTLTTYREEFCKDGTPDLSVEIKDSSGTPYTFYYYHMFDLLALGDKHTKSAGQSKTAPITLANRARLYGLNSMTQDTPAVLIVQYNSPNSVIYTSDINSVSADTAGVIFVYKNGHVVGQDNINDKSMFSSLSKFSSDSIGILDLFSSATNTICGKSGEFCSSPVDRYTNSLSLPVEFGSSGP